LLCGLNSSTSTEHLEILLKKMPGMPHTVIN